jgi:hypothetical protein
MRCRPGTMRSCARPSWSYSRYFPAIRGSRTTWPRAKPCWGIARPPSPRCATGPAWASLPTTRAIPISHRCAISRHMLRRSTASQSRRSRSRTQRWRSQSRIMTCCLRTSPTIRARAASSTPACAAAASTPVKARSSLAPMRRDACSGPPPRGSRTAKPATRKTRTRPRCSLSTWTAARSSSASNRRCPACSAI